MKLHCFLVRSVLFCGLCAQSQAQDQQPFPEGAQPAQEAAQLPVLDANQPPLFAALPPVALNPAQDEKANAAGGVAIGNLPPVVEENLSDSDQESAEDDSEQEEQENVSKKRKKSQPVKRPAKRKKTETAKQLRTEFEDELIPQLRKKFAKGDHHELFGLYLDKMEKICQSKATKISQSLIDGIQEKLIEPKKKIAIRNFYLLILFETHRYTGDRASQNLLKFTEIEKNLLMLEEYEKNSKNPDFAYAESNDERLVKVREALMRSRLEDEKEDNQSAKRRDLTMSFKREMARERYQRLIVPILSKHQKDKNIKKFKGKLESFFDKTNRTEMLDKILGRTVKLLQSDNDVKFFSQVYGAFFTTYSYVKGTEMGPKHIQKVLDRYEEIQKQPLDYQKKYKGVLSKILSQDLMMHIDKVFLVENIMDVSFPRYGFSFDRYSLSAPFENFYSSKILKNFGQLFFCEEEWRIEKNAEALNKAFNALMRETVRDSKREREAFKDGALRQFYLNEMLDKILKKSSQDQMPPALLLAPENRFMLYHGIGPLLPPLPPMPLANAGLNQPQGNVQQDPGNMPMPRHGIAPLLPPQPPMPLANAGLNQPQGNLRNAAAMPPQPPMPLANAGLNQPQGNLRNAAAINPQPPMPLANAGLNQQDVKANAAAGNQPQPNRNLKRHDIFQQEKLSEVGWSKQNPIKIEDLNRLKEILKQNKDSGALYPDSTLVQYVEMPYKKPKEIDLKSLVCNPVEFQSYVEVSSLIQAEIDKALKEISLPDVKEKNIEESLKKYTSIEEQVRKSHAVARAHADAIQGSNFSPEYIKERSEFHYRQERNSTAPQIKALQDKLLKMTKIKYLKGVKTRIDDWQEIYLNRQKIGVRVCEMIEENDFKPFVLNHSSVSSEKRSTWIHLESGYMMKGSSDRGIFAGYMDSDGGAHYDGIEIEARLGQYHQIFKAAFENFKTLQAMEVQHGSGLDWFRAYASALNQNDICADARMRTLSQWILKSDLEISKYVSGLDVETALNQAYMATYARKDLEAGADGVAKPEAFYVAMKAEVEKIKLKNNGVITPDMIQKYIDQKNKELGL